MAAILALDIESVPLVELWEAEVGRMEVLEGVWGAWPGLHPATSEVVSVGFGWLDHDRAVTDVLCQRMVGPESEAKLLQAALGRLAGASAKGTRVVSFNGTNFDLPMLRIRAAVLGLKPSRLPWESWLKPWNSTGHLDLRLTLAGARGKGTQEAWAELFGIAAESRGSDVLSMVREGKWEELEAYNASDVLTLLNLYRRLEAVL